MHPATSHKRSIPPGADDSFVSVDYRSCLYVPGDRRDLLDKARVSPADSLIIDFEDAVAPSRKDVALQTTLDWLDELQPFATPDIWVRTNPGGRGRDEIDALAQAPGIVGLCLAKANSRAEVEATANVLEAADSTIVLAPILEDAVGVAGAADIAQASRVVRLQMGEADLRAELGIEISPGELEMLFLRSRLVLVSAAAGLTPPLGPVATNFRDQDALVTSTSLLRRLGYFGRACIHPAQVPIVNAVFTPSAVEVDRARELVAAHTGGGSSLKDQFVDEAVVRSARRTIALAERLSPS